MIYFLYILCVGEDFFVSLNEQEERTMKKRISSLLLALCMVLSLVPAAAAAGETAELASAQPLYAYWVGQWHNGGDRGALIEGNGEGRWIGDWGDSWSVLFYTDEQGASMLPADAVVTYVPDDGTLADIVRVTSNDLGSWNVSYTAIGSGTLQVTVDGVTYERSVLSRLPHDGWCTQTTLTVDTYIPSRKFMYSDTQRTFYYVYDPDVGVTINNVSGAGDLAWSISKNVVTFTVPGGYSYDGRLDIQLQVSDTSGESWTRHADIYLINGTRHIAAQSDYRNNDIFEREDDTYNSGTKLEPGYETGRVFYIMENGAVTLAQHYSVSSSNEAVMTVERLGDAANTGNPVWNIRAHSFGTADVVLTFDSGEVLTYPVTVDVPWLSWATGPALNRSTYLGGDLYYDSDQYVFYAAFSDSDSIFNTFALESGFEEYADALTIDFTPGSSYAKVTLDPTSDKLDGAYIEFRHTGNSGNGRICMNLSYAGEKLVGRWVGGNRQDLRENMNDESMSRVRLNPTYTHWVVFCSSVRGVETVLSDITSVVSSDTSVVDVYLIGTSDLGSPVYEISGKSLGSCTITVTCDGGKTMTIPVTVTLPDNGWSTGPVLNMDTWLPNSITYTDTQRTFYYSQRGGALTSFAVASQYSQYADCFDIELASDGSYAKVTVKEGVTIDNVRVGFADAGNWTNGGSWNGVTTIRFINGGDKLAFTWVNGNPDDLREEQSGEYDVTARLDPGSGCWAVFCLSSGDTITPLTDITSVVSNDESVATARLLGTSDLGNPVYEIYGVDFGSTSVTVTYGGGKTLTMPVNVTLPSRGWSSATTLTEATFLPGQLSHMEDTPTVYYVTRNGKLTSFELDDWCREYAGDLTVEISADGTYAAVTLKDKATLDGVWIGFRSCGAYDNGGTWDHGCSVQFNYSGEKAVWNSCWRENGELVEESKQTNSGFSVDMGNHRFCIFYLSSGGQLTALQDIISVTSSDESVFTVSYEGVAANTGHGVYNVRGVMEGTASVIVTYDGGKTLSLPVSVFLPEFAWSTAPALTTQSFVDEEFTYSKSSPTVYFVATGAQINSFRLDDRDSQLADCFTITIDPTGTFASVTVVDGAPLAGRGISFCAELTNDAGYTWDYHAGMRFNNGDAPVLGTPTGLKWNVTYNWSDTETARMGSVGFTRADPDQGKYEVEFYQVGSSAPVLQGSWGYGSGNEQKYYDMSEFIYADLPSGDYYFRIRAVGDGYNYRDGEWAASDVWTYTEPQAQLTIPTILHWSQANDEIFMNWSGVEDSQYYDVKVFYAETETGEKEEVGGSFDFHSPQMHLREQTIAQHGEGWYFFRVRAISGDITQIRNSAWSDFSPGFCLGDVIATVNSALDNIDTAGSTVEDVQKAVGVIENLDEALAADTDNSGTAATIAKLEEEIGITTTVDTANAPAGFDGAAVQVTGAALNVDVAAGVDKATLTISEVDESDPPEKLNETLYKNTIQFALDIPQAKDDDPDTAGLQLAVPVKITLPIPENISPAFLVVLHYKESIQDWEELRWPHVYQDETTGKWFATFVVDSMSPFALVERQSSAWVENGTIRLDAYLPTTGGKVEFLCAVYSKDGQMLDLLKLQSHAEPVTIELEEIQEGMYLKVISANAGQGWVPLSGAQEIPVN